jgi:hypothetical protein
MDDDETETKTLPVKRKQPASARKTPVSKRGSKMRQSEDDGEFSESSLI